MLTQNKLARFPSASFKDLRCICEQVRHVQAILANDVESSKHFSLFCNNVAAKERNVYDVVTSRVCVDKNVLYVATNAS